MACSTTCRRSTSRCWATKAAPRKGRVVLFPPYWTHVHRGATPVSGAKYTIAAFLCQRRQDRIRLLLVDALADRDQRGLGRLAYGFIGCRADQAGGFGNSLIVVLRGNGGWCGSDGIGHWGAILAGTVLNIHCAPNPI